MNNIQFYRPGSLEHLAETLKLKAQNSDMFLVAGGTDFSIFRRKQNLSDFSVIDLTQIEEMKGIEQHETCIEVGAAVTMTAIEKSDLLRTHARALTEAAGHLGSSQIRNRATLGGNMVNAAQCADTVTAACALGASVVLMNADGLLRELLLEDFIYGIGKTRLHPDEAMIRIKFPRPSYNVYSGFAKVGSRKTVSISKINLAMNFVFQDSTIAKASICLGSIGPRTVRAEAMERFCAGKKWDLDLLEPLLMMGSTLIDEAIPGRSSRHYKRIAVKGLISDVFENISSQRRGESE